MNPDVFLLTGILGVALGAVVAAYCLFDRAHRRAAVRNQLAEARARVGFPPPAPDNVPGINTADLDACELIYALPDYEPTNAEEGQ